MIREVIATPAPHPTPEQLSVFEAKLAELRLIDRGAKAERIMCYYRVGTALQDVFEDANRGAVRYGQNAIGRIAESLGYDASTLYRAQEVAVRFTEPQIRTLCGLPAVGWSHILEVVRVQDGQQRMALLTQLEALPETQQTVSALRLRVAEVRQEAASATQPEEARPKAQTISKGGGSRTGTGHGASPLTPVKKAFKHAESLTDSITSVIVMLKDFSPDNEMVAEKVAKELNATAGVMVEALTQIAAAMPLVEEYVGEFNYGEDQSARKSMSSQALVSLQSFLAGEKAAEVLGHEDSGSAGVARSGKDVSPKPGKSSGSRAAPRTATVGPPPASAGSVARVVEARREAALRVVRKG